MMSFFRQGPDLALYSAQLLKMDPGLMLLLILKVIFLIAFALFFVEVLQRARR